MRTVLVFAGVLSTVAPVAAALDLPGLAGVSVAKLCCAMAKSDFTLERCDEGIFDDRANFYLQDLNS